MQSSSIKAAPAGLLALFFLAFLMVLPESAFSQPKSYRLGPGDVIELKIEAGGDVQNDVKLTVSADGTINAPFLGNVRAEGLTSSELEKALTIPLERDYFVNPKVNIYIEEYHSLSYHISGAVKKPGLYETSAEPTLLELIAKAEGATAERGKWAYIMHEGSKTEDPIKVDLVRLMDQGDMSININLAPGDVVYIPPVKSLDQAESQLSVEGEVKSPGLFPYQPGITALTACAMAGGFDTFAAANRTKIIRKKGDGIEIIEVDLEDVQEGKAPDIELQPGDRIHVPESWL